MIKYLFHILKIIKSIFLRPKKTFFWIISDFKKDLDSKNYKSKFNYVWCVGLPKSGTTLIENIFDHLPYVRQNASFNRLFYPGKLDHIHGISEEIFKFTPKNKFTFIKTHTHYSKKYENISLKYNLKIILSLRDLRDMLISRYYHILSDNSHWLHSRVKKLNITQGFILSLKEISPSNYVSNLDYFFYWINDWLEVARKNNYLILWYEQYQKNPIEYIQKILDYVEFKNFDPNIIHKNLILKNNSKRPLEESLFDYGREKSTFRKGNIKEWKDFFNDEINDYFYNNIPSDFDKIKYKD